ncbi:MAG: ABC transporter permease [Eubacteriales bacterium]|nr:ABC transporter permease [Eubacteriales bacterium]
MGRLFKYEGYKIKRSKYWWICLLVGIAMIGAQLIGTKMLQEMASTMSQQGVEVSMRVSEYGFAQAAPSVLAANSILIAIVVSLFIGSDFANGTIKNIASKGLGRGHIVTVKFIWANLLTVLGLVIISVFGLGLAYAILDHSTVTAEVWREIAKLFGLSVLQNLAYTSIFAFGSILLATGGAAIAFNIGLTVLVPPLVMLAQSLLVKSETFTLNNLFPYFLGDLSMIPGMTKEHWIYAAAMLVYALISFIAAVVIFKKRDIK